MKNKMVQVMLLSSAITTLPALTLQAAAEELAEAPWRTIFMVDENTLWLGSDDGRIAVSADAGQTWRHSHPGGRTSDLNLSQIIAFDERHAYTLSTGRGERSRLYVTRNGGFSWRRLYRGNGDESLRCFDLIPDGEAWVLGDTLLDNWHVVRSSNGNHWLSSRSGFAERALFAEEGSQYGHCVRYANNMWAMGTRNAETARLIYKTRTALRFQVVDTPLSSGTNAGVEAVYPLGPRHILIAGGRTGEEPSAELYRYQDGQFTAVNLPTAASSGTQTLTQPITQLYAWPNRWVIASSEGVYSSSNSGETWSTLSQQGVINLSCTESGCWAISSDHALVQIEF